MIESIPGRASDAGPDSADSVRDWREYLSQAEEEIRTCGRFAADSLATQYRVRVRCIEDAIRSLECARAVLPLTPGEAARRMGQWFTWPGGEGPQGPNGPSCTTGVSHK